MDFKIHEKDLLEYKRKRYARYISNYSLKVGKIKKSGCCDLCNGVDVPLSAHHVDYGKPLEIIWLCSTCHGLVHRKNHKLNPKNNKQTFITNMNEKFETVSINITIPVENYCAIKNKSIKSKIPMSKIIKDLIMCNFSVQDEQLQFKFMEKKYDKAQDEQNKGVRSVEGFGRRNKKPPAPALQKVGCERFFDLPSVGKGLFSVLS